MVIEDTLVGLNAVQCWTIQNAAIDIDSSIHLGWVEKNRQGARRRDGVAEVSFIEHTCLASEKVKYANTKGDSCVLEGIDREDIS